MTEQVQFIRFVQNFVAAVVVAPLKDDIQRRAGQTDKARGPKLAVVPSLKN